MRENILIEVSNILDTFNIAELSILIKEQIRDDTDDFTNITTNYFKPLYYNFAKLTKYDLDEDIKRDAEDRFFEICQVFIDEICKKYNLQIDPEWVSSKYDDIPAITLALYSFFVLDFVQNIYEVTLNYILDNSDLVFKTFEEMKNKKDASTLTNKKTLSPEMTIVISNIYDIVKWIFLNISEEDFLDYLDNEYVPLKLIKPLFSEGKINGEFVDVIADMLNRNVALNSKIGFDFTINVKTGVIRDIYA